MDNDIYGHVNNVTYYSYFDTTINRYLIEVGGLDINNAPVVGYVVNSNCQFKKPVAYPDALEAGLRVIRIGNSSVTYELGLFRNGDVDPAALGQVVHVFVDREQNRAAAIPQTIREALERILIS
ncbi:acyl-CoA thioesterase [Marinobacter panjinensis]|uniref:Acyl-CoA thioesterase n=2 Tax=Marinobacter panjinensis TaxID=2576384 RepID=A0A4V6CUK3_9GAMM|nr:acyl-CoA thioesterase [Marinobacter panjinensis]